MLCVIPAGPSPSGGSFRPLKVPSVGLLPPRFRVQVPMPCAPVLRLCGGDGSWYDGCRCQNQGSQPTSKFIGIDERKLPRKLCLVCLHSLLGFIVRDRDRFQQAAMIPASQHQVVFLSWTRLNDRYGYVFAPTFPSWSSDGGRLV